MIGIIMGIAFIVLGISFSIVGITVFKEEMIFAGIIILIIGFLILCIVPAFTGVVNYEETFDYDRARITAVDTRQTPFRTYWKIDVEYLTNTPVQQGIVTNNRIETDTYYTDNKELVEKLRQNMYKEIKIISGFKGGYETWRTFRDKLIKDFELIEE